jgi:SPP1 family predicted phage head-tail adaptor
MDKSRVITLITTVYEPDALGQLVPAETSKNVFCNISSVSASEWFEAGREGLRAEYRATMFAHDYSGEQIAELDGVRYGIYRTFLGRNETIELYLERKAGYDVRSKGI